MSRRGAYALYVLRKRPPKTDKTLALTLGRAVAGAALVVAGLPAARGRAPAAVRRRAAPEQIPA